MGRHFEMSTATIYALCDSRIVDPITSVRYIGQTRIALDQRLKRHWVTALAGAREHRAVWMRAMRAAGVEVLILSLGRVPSDEADAAESTQIARFRALGCDLTNRTDGGRGRRGWEVSAATRRKMSESARRRGAHSAEAYRKAGETIKANPTHRRHLENMHERNRGTTRTPTQRERIGHALRGERNGQAVLTQESVATIRARYAAGVRQAQLVRDFKVSPATIHRVVHYNGWVSA